MLKLNNMWIARDRNGELWLFKGKPIKDEEEGRWTISSPVEEGIGELPFTLFPELKWEDEPIEVDLVPKGKTNKTNKTDITVTRENIIFNDSYWTALRNNTAMAAMATMLEKWNNISSPSVLEEACELSVTCADALIEKLKSKTKEKNL